jgi:hypothetical protein
MSSFPQSSDNSKNHKHFDIGIKLPDDQCLIQNLLSTRFALRHATKGAPQLWQNVTNHQFLHFSCFMVPGVTTNSSMSGADP